MQSKKRSLILCNGRRLVSARRLRNILPLRQPAVAMFLVLIINNRASQNSLQPDWPGKEPGHFQARPIPQEEPSLYSAVAFAWRLCTAWHGQRRVLHALDATPRPSRCPLGWVPPRHGRAKIVLVLSRSILVQLFCARFLLIKDTCNGPADAGKIVSGPGAIESKPLTK